MLAHYSFYHYFFLIIEINGKINLFSFCTTKGDDIRSKRMFNWKTFFSTNQWKTLILKNTLTQSISNNRNISHRKHVKFSFASFTPITSSIICYSVKLIDTSKMNRYFRITQRDKFSISKSTSNFSFRKAVSLLSPVQCCHFRLNKYSFTCAAPFTWMSLYCKRVAPKKLSSAPCPEAKGFHEQRSTRDAWQNPPQYMPILRPAP